jgi:hypothetical protein
LYVARDGADIGQFSEEEFRAGKAKERLNSLLSDRRLFERKEPANDSDRLADEESKTPMSEASAEKKMRRGSSPAYTAYIGALLAIVAAFIPLVNWAFFWFLSLPLVLATFVLAIVSLVRGGITGGVILMIGVFLAFPISILTALNREQILKSSQRVRERVEEKKREERQQATDTNQHSPAQNEFAASKPSPTTPDREMQAETPEPTFAPQPTKAVLKQSVIFQLPYGNVTLPAGTELEFVSRDASEVHLRYIGDEQIVPDSAVDLK